MHEVVSRVFYFALPSRRITTSDRFPHVTISLAWVVGSDGCTDKQAKAASKILIIVILVVDVVIHIFQLEVPFI